MVAPRTVVQRKHRFHGELLGPKSVAKKITVVVLGEAREAKRFSMEGVGILTTVYTAQERFLLLCTEYV